MVCVHGHGSGFVDVLKGEKYRILPQAYEMFLKGLDEEQKKKSGKTTLVGYDICCLFEKWLETHTGEVAELMKNVNLVGPSFHINVHNFNCYNRYHPAFVPGSGIAEFEGNERFWSWLKARLPKSAIYLKHGNRRDTIQVAIFCINVKVRGDAVADILRRHKRAKDIIAQFSLSRLPKDTCSDAHEHDADARELQTLSDECTTRLHKMLITSQLKRASKSDRNLVRSLEKKIKNYSKQLADTIFAKSNSHVVAQDQMTEMLEKHFGKFQARKRRCRVRRAIEETLYCVREAKVLMRNLTKEIEKLKLQLESAGDEHFATQRLRWELHETTKFAEKSLRELEAANLINADRLAPEFLAMEADGDDDNNDGDNELDDDNNDGDDVDYEFDDDERDSEPNDDGNDDDGDDMDGKLPDNDGNH
jgi:hypothetical protein